VIGNKDRFGQLLTYIFQKLELPFTTNQKLFSLLSKKLPKQLAFVLKILFKIIKRRLLKGLGLLKNKKMMNVPLVQRRVK